MAGKTSEGDAAGWLRGRGLPSFVVAEERGTLLLARTVPFLTLVSCAETGQWMLDRSIVSIDVEAPVLGLLLLALHLLALAVLAAIPVVALRVSSGWLCRWPQGMTAAGCMLVSYHVAVAPWLAGHPEPLTAIPRAAVVVALALVATRCGVGSMVSWALRSAVRQFRALPQLTSRALPVLMLVVVVSVFSRALWEVAAALDAQRLAGVVSLFALLGVFFIVPVTRVETAGLANPGPALSAAERVNVILVMVFAQALQVAIFAALVCVFLVTLGQLAFAPTLLDSWLGPGRAPLELLGVRLPVDVVLVKTAVLLSCVSSLNFLVTATSNAAYRSAFYDPLFEDARAALLVRATHRAPAALVQQEPAAEDWE